MAKIDNMASGSNSKGIPYGQTPGFKKGTAAESMNNVTSNAKVHKPASSHLMAGDSHNRGAEHKGSGG